MDGSEKPAEGLRARKRAAARSGIEEAAVALALEHGYEHVTVDMICTASMMSPRTFFNYFGSKEGVFLGPAPAAATQAAARAFLADADTPVVLSLAAAVVSALLEGQPNPGLARRRMLVIVASPELLSKQHEWMSVQENQLTDLVLARYAARARPEPAAELAAEARMAVGLALGMVRVVLQQSLIEHDGAWPDAAALERAGELAERLFGPPHP